MCTGIIKEIKINTTNDFHVKQVKPACTNFAVYESIHNKWYNYENIAIMVSSLCDILKKDNVCKDSCVMISLEDSVEFIVAQFAANQLGIEAIVARRIFHIDSIDANYYEDKVTHILCKDCDREMIFQIFGEKVKVISVEKDQLIQNNEVHDIAISFDMVAEVSIFSSGSTKGYETYTKHSIINILNAASEIIRFQKLSSEDVILASIPLSYSFGLVSQVYATFLCGAKIYIPQDRSSSSIYKAIKSGQITVLNGVPDTYIGLINSFDCQNIKLRTGLIGGAPYSKRTFVNIENKLGIEALLPSYGSSEFLLITGCSIQEPLEVRANTVGKVIELYDYKIDNIDSSNDGKEEKTGVLYLKHKTSESWSNTKDIFSLDDDGNMHFIGRSDDTFFRGGINIYPAKLSNIITDTIKYPCIVFPLDYNEVTLLVCGIFGMKSKIIHDAELHFPLLYKTLPKNQIPDLFIGIHNMPVNKNGKPNMQVLRKYLLDILEHEYTSYGTP